MKNRNRFLAFLLAVSMTGGCMGACSDAGDQNAEDTETENAGAAAEQEALVLASGALKGRFSEFFAESEADRQIAELTSVRLLEQTRGGNYVLQGCEGETEIYNDTEYHYDGIADCSIKRGGDGSVTYQFSLRKDVTFSDGTPLTADDAIFSMYVYLDPSYEGTEKLNTLPIRGLADYRGNASRLYELILQAGEENREFEHFTKKQQKKFFSTYWPKAKKKFIADIVEQSKAKSIAKAMIALGYAQKNEDTGVLRTNTLREWTLKGKDKPKETDFWDEIMRNSIFGGDVAVMSKSMVDGGLAKQGVFDYLPPSYRKTVDAGGNSVRSISGIERNGKFRFSVTLDETDPTATGKLAIAVCPLHYYGDADKYKYKKSRFGFTKGDLSSIQQKNEAPLGAGPYIFEKYENHVVSFSANQAYWRGAPAVPGLQVKEIADGDMAVGIAEGKADIACPTMTKSDLEQIRNVNTNHTENGDMFSTTFVDTDSFGYIGINAQNVCVNDEPMSERSVNLRKAFATVFSYYRFASVYDYYGNTAQIVNYQISNTSWAAPKKGEIGYLDAYNRRLGGGKIYRIRDTESAREAAVKRAVLEYFEAAGFSLEGEKISGVPHGASDKYEVMVTGYGKKDHPSYHILRKSAKLLKSVGIRLKIKDLADSGEMFAACQSGTAQMWCAAWPKGDDPDTYFSALFSGKGGTSYMFGASSAELDALLKRAKETDDREKRKELYRRCLDEIIDFAVEVPIYQRQECTLYSTRRVDMETVTKDQTATYNWKNEIYHIQKK